MWPFKKPAPKPDAGEFSNITDEQWSALVDDMCVMFNSKAWRVFMSEMANARDALDTVQDVGTMEDFWRKRGRIETYNHLLNYSAMIEQGRE